MQQTASGLSFSSLLTVLFIGLKLTGHIEWSWLWVLSPIWIPAGLLLGIALLSLIVFTVLAVLKKRRRRNRK